MIAGEHATERDSVARGAPIPGVECFPTLDAALQACTEETVFIIGGAEIYRLALPLAHTLLLTQVHQQVAGDTKFPDHDRTQWREVSRDVHPGYTFVEFQRARQ
jgi:dihydrofolate reductase